MAEGKPQSEMQTRPLGEPPTAELSVIYVIPHLRWEREWFDTFEISRAKLLETLEQLNKQLSADRSTGKHQTQYFLLAGQTVILEDISEIRPDLVATLVIFNAGGRLGIGPWYVNVDESLVSGESLVRNLLAAQDDGTRYGLKLMPVAYVPDLNRHTSQLPQILRGFGINTALLRHGAPVVDMPFRWEAPDGSSILVVNHDSRMIWPHAVPGAFDIFNSIKAQHEVRPDGPYLWLFDSGNATRSISDIAQKLEKQTGYPVRQSDPITYVRALRGELTDTFRPAIKGELRLQSLRQNAYLLSGTLSTRLHIKQQNAQIQTRLSYQVEPWLAIALTHGEIKHPNNMRALLNYCWRLLLQTQSRNALGGSASDAVIAENEIRYRKIHDASSQIIENVLDALPGQLHLKNTPVNREEIYLVVWNPLNWPVRQAVDIQIELPKNRHPGQLAVPDGREQLYSWEPETNTLSFIAEAPGTGYSTYILFFDDTPPPPRYHIRTSLGTAIANGEGDTLTVTDDKLIWHSGNKVIEDVLRFFDGGDAGDTFNYDPPEEDVIVQGELIGDVAVETAPHFSRLILRHRMRIAPSLNDDRNRQRGLKLLEITTTATFYENIKGIHFKTSFVNPADDHRLRVHLRTGIESNSTLADTAYNIVERPIEAQGPIIPPENTPNVEGFITTHPAQSVISVEDSHAAVALVMRGLPEYEGIYEDGQITLALTLLRAVGWLGRDDLRSRTAPVAPRLETPDAQCKHLIKAEYALELVPSQDRATLMRVGKEFNIPLQVYQYDTPPERPSRSFLSVISHMGIGATSDGEGAILTAFKPPEEQDGWVVRLVNPHSYLVEVILTPHQRPEMVELMSLAEESSNLLKVDANGRVTLHINPHQIITLRFIF